MPDSTVYSTAHDSWVTNHYLSWTLARGSAITSGSAYSNTATSNDFGVYNIYTGGRGGDIYTVRRSFFNFDLSGESSMVASAEVKLYLNWLGSGSSRKVVLVAATALAGSTADFGNVFSGGTTLGATYSDTVNVITIAGYHTFTMLPAAITDIRSAVGSGNIIMGLMGYDFDYKNVAPSLEGDYTKVQVRYADYSGTSSDPKLELTYAKDDAIFFGANF